MEISNICMNCYHGEVCSSDNRLMARITGKCDSFDDKRFVLKLPYKVGNSVINFIDGEVVITSRKNKGE